MRYYVDFGEGRTNNIVTSMSPTGRVLRRVGRYVVFIEREPPMQAQYGAHNIIRQDENGLQWTKHRTRDIYNGNGKLTDEDEKTILFRLLMSEIW